MGGEVCQSDGDGGDFVTGDVSGQGVVDEDEAPQGDDEDVGPWLFMKVLAAADGGAKHQDRGE